MKLFYSFEILFFSILMLVPVQLNAQDRRFMTRQQIDSIMNPSLLADAEKMISFSKNIIDIGTLTEDDSPVDVVFPFKNIGKHRLVITRVNTFCGCTEATVDKAICCIGEDGNIIIQYNPKNHPGTINESAYVYTSLSEKLPVARLIIKGEVLPGVDYWSRFRYSMGPLRLKQQVLNFKFQSRRKLTERILCGNSGNSSIQLSVRHLPPYMEFYTEPSKILPGEDADIVIKVDASQLDSTVTVLEENIQLDGLNLSEKKSTLKVVIDLTEIK